MWNVCHLVVAGENNEEAVKLSVIEPETLAPPPPVLMHSTIERAPK